MKTSSGTARQPPKRSAAVNCLLVNQFATPGLGSLMAHRFIAGTVQLTLSIVGFGFFIGWFVQVCRATYRLVADQPPEPARYPWMGKAGLVIFAAAWFWAWITSLSVLRQARKNQAADLSTPRPIPPRINP